MDAPRLLRQMFDAAVAAADPALIVPPHLPVRPTGRLVVLGAGKASAAMAAAVEAHWDGPVEGLVITRYGHAVPTRLIEIVEAAHPVPDVAGEEAARRLLALASGLGPDDLALCLISGGGSALASVPAPGVTLADKQTLNRQLLACGATIGEMNTVRKHLSAIKGGRLAAACAPAQVVTLTISDVPGDDPAVIASGPTVPDPTTLADARAVVAKYGLSVPDGIRARLSDPAAETPKPGDGLFDRTEAVMVATPQQSLEAAATVAREAGLTPLILSDRMEGEARDVGIAHAGIAWQIATHGQPVAPPAVILSGGETTVTLSGQGGRGGRCTEFLLGFGLASQGLARVYALAADTDGIDGSEDNAGAWLGPRTLDEAVLAGVDPTQAQQSHDAYGVFDAAGTLVTTGPTLTNVNDFRACVVLG